MRGKILLVVMLMTVFFVGCQQRSKEYKVVTDPRSGKPMLVDKVDRQALMQKPFDEWFKSGYDAYVPDLKVFEGTQLPDFKVTIVFATWCPDSRLEVPRMLKILDDLHVPTKNIVMYCVDRKKEADNYDISKYNIERVPTFIFYVDGQEVGRIIEHPKTTLENDMYQILMGD